MKVERSSEGCGTKGGVMTGENSCHGFRSVCPHDLEEVIGLAAATRTGCKMRWHLFAGS